MNRQTLQFNLPDGWKVDFQLGHYEDEEFGESWDTEEYLIIPDKNDLFSRITVTKDINANGAIAPTDVLEHEAEQYLDGLNLPSSLRPNLYDFIKEFNIGDILAYYCIFQQPDEAGANIRVVFWAKDQWLVYVNAFIVDYEEGCGETAAIDFLSHFFVF